MVSLSNRGFPMLQAFINGGPNYYMSIVDAQSYDQRPFRSMLIRKYIVYKPRRNGFALTKEGREAYHIFMSTDIARKDPQMPLTAYFDPTAYGLKMPEKRHRTKPAEAA